MKINLIPNAENEETKKPVIHQKPMSILEMLNNDRKNAPSIEELFNINMIEKQLGIKTEFNNNSLYVPKPGNIQAGIYNNIDAYWVNVICNTISNLPQNEKPIYCSNQRLHHFFIKTNNAWTKNEGDVETSLKRIIQECIKGIGHLFNNLTKNIPIRPSIDNDELKELLKRNNEKALAYVRNKPNFNIWFYSVYSKNYDEWHEKARMETITAIWAVDETKVLTKLKISLSLITGDKMIKYVEDKEVIPEPIEEEEYDYEKDPNKL